MPLTMEAASPMAASAARGLLLNESSTVEPIQVIYGSRRVGGARVFLQASA
jgi:predicted phage tail protein